MQSNFYMVNISNIVEKRISSIDASRTYTISTNGKISEAIYFKSNSGRIIGLCISSQFGCQMQCQFCANKDSIYEGNICFDAMKEIIGVIEHDIIDAGLPLPNTYDFKGIGEPLLNLENVVLTYYYLKRQRSDIVINLSTCGVVRNIYKLADIDDCNMRLFWSMHSPFQSEREIIMPSAKNNKITDIVSACVYYSKKKRVKVTASYLLLGNNYSQNHIEKVVELLSPDFFDIEILLYNYVDGAMFIRPSDEEAYIVRDYFRKNGFESNVIISKGRDTRGGCGQLWNRYSIIN